MRKTILTAALLCAFLGTQAQEYYEKHVAFPAGATTEQKIDMASRLVPTPQQLAWQQMEFTCFLHFGINTFTGREWGDGKEDPAIFNPTELDCEQWVRALKEGGFKMAIITAKHHIMGDDVRWVGNEGGLGRTTEWSATALMPNSYPGSDEVYKRLGINAMSKDLGSRELVSKASDLFWYPSEVDVSIRPGWFYHAEQDNQVRSLANLVNIYYRSVGCNSVLLLNIPPDKRGLMHENDVKRIKELTEYIKKTFADNKVEKGNRIWTAKVGDTKEYKVRKNTLVNTFLIQEDITKGQRVEGFTVEVFANGAWHHVGEGTTVGYKRLLPFSDSHAEKVRVTITGARGTVNISNIGLYYAEPLVDKTMKVTLSDVPVDGWKTVGMDAAAAIDGKQETVWKTETLTPLVVDMGKEVEIAGFSYAPAQEEDLTGTIYKYNFYVSRDGKDWMKCDATGEFSNIMHNPVPYFVRFGKTYPARYFKCIWRAY